MVSFTLVVATGALCAVGALGFLWWKRRRDEDAVRHILRLAAEIEAVATTVDADLEDAADDPPCVVFRQRCRDARRHAADALVRGEALRQQDAEALITTLLLLHDDHRRVVDLRSEVDRALARRAKPHGEDRSRVIRIGRPKPSVWPTSSMLTRPSTFS
jgi:hypothetical protein